MDTYCEEYKDIKKLAPTSLRRIARNAALTGLSIVDTIAGNFKYLNKPRVQFLYIHHAFKDEEEKLDLLLGKLKQNHTFISYSEAVERVLKSNIDKPYITLSSDDGFKNNLNILKILNKHGAKACFFINPSIVGESDFEKIKNYCKTRLHFPPIEFLTWEDVEKIQSAGHEIGSHTMSHINISAATTEQMTEEISKSYEVIKNHCGQVSHFAYPYGAFSNFTLSAKKIVFETGYLSCTSAVRGCHIEQGTTLENDKLCIRRDHIILDWNINHIMHFLIHNSRKASVVNNFFPESMR